MADLNAIADQLSELTVMEAAELAKLSRRSGASLPPLRWP